MKLPIITIPNPILRQKSKPVKKITPELLKFAQDMLETAKEDGVGLSAPQVGKNIRLLVTNYTPKDKDEADTDLVPKTILFNPKITSFSAQKDKLSEGCLSLPGLSGVVERSLNVTISGLNELNEKVNINASNLFARVLQHEVDHLDGILFTDRLKKYRVIFYGTSDFAVPTLSALIAHPQFTVVGVVTETDKPAGRGHQLLASPIKQIADQNQIKVLQPISLRTKHPEKQISESAKGVINELKSLKPDIQVVASYGKILTPQALKIAPSINIHPSLLPKYRGATPIQSAILNGETETGISIILMTPEMDAGPVLAMYKYPIKSEETSGELASRLSKSAAKLLIMSLETIISDKAEVWEQDNLEASYTQKIDSQMAEIDWNNKPEVVVNHIRAYSPKPGAWAMLNGKKIKFLKAHLAEDKLVIDLIQLESKQPMQFSALKNGYPHIYKSIKELSENIG